MARLYLGIFNAISILGINIASDYITTPHSFVSRARPYYLAKLSRTGWNPSRPENTKWWLKRNFDSAPQRDFHFFSFGGRMSLIRDTNQSWTRTTRAATLCDAGRGIRNEASSGRHLWGDVDRSWARAHSLVLVSLCLYNYNTFHLRRLSRGSMFIISCWKVSQLLVKVVVEMRVLHPNWLSCKERHSLNSTNSITTSHHLLWSNYL